MSKVVVLLSLFALPLRAQLLDVTVTPNPAPMGTPITLSVLASLPNQFTLGGCLVTEIRQGTPTGPTVRFFPCTFLGVAIPQCGPGAVPRTLSWNQTGAGAFAGQVPPGDYYFSLSVTNGLFGPVTQQSISVRIDATPPLPSLVQTMPATVGGIAFFQLTAAARPFDGYLTALSLSTNTGFQIPGGPFIGLDYDPLFELSFTGQLPTLLVDFTGSLDGAGQASTIAIVLPNDPIIQCLPLFMQSVVFPITTALPLEATNVASFFIQ